ncbi:ParA family protein [Marinitoga litoralis]|jgi:chromosome partitioning protein|uniref:ParA family protein n=1 Tax=Marinitoga litoralis TaxID=570855 RepID=UPI001961D0E5|nr:ParA family protein [Marinitoga litoralis]MBM7558582.1 chromosome partitioning protein [Marinitoga litoralis]
MAKVIVLANRKGGSGKTTLAFNLSHAFKSKKTFSEKILLIDFDSQAHSTVYAGINPFDVKYGIYEMIVDYINTGKYKDGKISMHNIDIIPSNQNLAALEIELAHHEERNFVLKDLIIDFHNEYDYIFIDTPPSLGLLTINALNASDYLLIPVKSDFLSLVGLSQMMEIYYKVNVENPNLKILGVIPTMVDKRTKISKEIIGELKKIFGDKKVFTPLRNDVKLIESSSHGIPIIKYAPKSRASSDIKKIAKEIQELIK